MELIGQLQEIKQRADKTWKKLFTELKGSNQDLFQLDKSADTLQLYAEKMQESKYFIYRQCLNEMIQTYLRRKKSEINHDLNIEKFIHQMNKEYHKVDLEEECIAFLLWVSK
ncbi:MAG TPA: hypothetical protein DCW90_09110 [Lachnospiraceae bacterium]|nr:hypothetical protein [Lachnospiraceae bacterium]